MGAMRSRRNVAICRPLKCARGTPCEFLRLLLVSIVLFAAAIPARVSAQSVSEAEQAELAGSWRGNWSAPEDWLYEAVMTLRVTASGAVTGEINWTIRKSARPAEQAKLG